MAQHWLFKLIRDAALRRAALIETKISKHRPVADGDKGLAASVKYLGKKRLSRGTVSTLRKIKRSHRIAAGERPLTFDVPGKRERKAAQRAASRKMRVA